MGYERYIIALEERPLPDGRLWITKSNKRTHGFGFIETMVPFKKISKEQRSFLENKMMGFLIANEKSYTESHFNRRLDEIKNKRALVSGIFILSKEECDFLNIPLHLRVFVINVNNENENYTYEDRIIINTDDIKLISLSEINDKEKQDISLPKEKEEGEERKKETSEVQEADLELSDEVHGGENNSQEVEDSEAKTSSENSNNNNPSDGEKQLQKDINKERGNQGKQGKGHSEAKGIKQIFCNENLEVSFDELVEKERPIHNVDDKELKDGGKTLIKALKNIFKEFGIGNPSRSIGGLNESRRIDSKAFVKQILNKKYEFERAHRKEMATIPKKVIVAADTSGSCSTTSPLTTKVCKYLTKEWKDLIYINHENGRIVEIGLEGKLYVIKYKYQSHEVSNSLWNKFGSISSGALLMGDTDGISVWSQLWRNFNIPTILMDSYKCSILNGMLKEYNNEFIGTLYDPETNQDLLDKNCNPKLTYYFGVNSIETISYGLRKYLREKC
jgi:hypothetical protein